MENPQAQMPQGQPGQAPEQMQQGAPQGQPQQGGQDPQMQQIMQLVQQMMQQGAQPADAAAELLAKQVPPEMIMQVFVQMGMPEQDAQAAIEQAMQGGQQPQNPGEEQMEGQASNPQEEMAEQSAPAPDQGGQPSPAEEIQMRYGGRMPRRLRSYAEGGDNQEMQAVMQQVQDMMSQGSDARQVMEQIQAAVQQGQISPEVGASVMEQLGGMQQATDPQGDDAAMMAQSQDPQMVDPNMAAPEAQMMKFGGNLKKLMSRAYGGPAVAPGTDSKTYAKDRTSMFVSAVKNSAYKSTLDDEFPSLGGNQMAYGGDLPKALNGIIMKDGKLTIDPTQFKSEAEYKAAALDWNMDPANKDNQVTGDLLKTNAWKEPELKPEAGKQYELDATTGKLKVVVPKNQFQFAEGDIMGQDAQGSYVTRKDGTMQRIPSMQNQGAQTAYSQINPVAYQNPMNQGLYGNLFAGASPFARMMSGIGTNNMYDPRITGANLPGGMNANQFLGAVGANGLVPGMAGNVAGQNWRIGEAEKFKEGSIWKGNRRKGVRYQIDWGDAVAMNPAAPAGPQVGPANSITPINGVTQYAGYQDANGLNPAPGGTTLQTDIYGNQTAMAPPDWRNAGTQVPGTVSFNQPSAANVANQSLVAPGSTDVVNPASEVNQVDQNANAGAGSSGFVPTVQTETGVKGIEDGKLVEKEYRENKYDRQANRQLGKDDRQANRQLRRDDRAAAAQPDVDEQELVAAAMSKKEDAFKGTADDNPYIPYEGDRKDYRSDRAYYKDAYPELSRTERKDISKNFSLGDVPNYNASEGTPTYESKQDMRNARQESRQANRAENKEARQELVSNVKGMLAGQRNRAYGGEPGDCPEGMVWSEEEQTCVSIANTPESKPLDASIAVGENNQFTANYSGAVGPNGIATSNVGFGYNPNENTSLKGSYDANNQSVMLQGKKTWDVGNGQLGVSGGYTAPVGGMNRGNFNGNVYYDTQLGKGANAVPVKLNFGIGQQAYGGNVDPAALENAIALINRAFGGRIPRADNGINLGSEDTDGNKIPDYLQAENLPVDPFSNNGTIEQSAGKKLDINWNQVGAAAGDMYMNGAGKVTNFMNKMHAINPERDKAKLSALNRPSNTYDTMKQGLYDQAGNFIPNDIGNQVLNPTDTNYNNQRQIFAYGGRVYEIGGQVDLDDNEMEQLAAAGFKLSRV